METNGTQSPIIAADDVVIPAIRRVAKNPIFPRGTVVLAHGITSEKTEESLFDILTKRLNALNWNTIQFDFRGHGDSTVPTHEMTIAGEILDLVAVLHETAAQTSTLILVASSFATVSAALLPREWKERLVGLVLLNPVLSIENTFLQPQLPWQRRNFGRQRIEAACVAGGLLVDDRFLLGERFLRELLTFAPEMQLEDFTCPLLVVHGDRDSFTSYQASRQLTERMGNERAAFVTICGAEHGFHRDHETERVGSELASFVQRVATPA